MSYVRDIIGLSGLALLLFGLWQWYAPSAYIVGGAVLAGGAILSSVTKKQNDPR